MVNLLSELPFFGMSNAQLIWESETCKQTILEKMNNNGFIDYIRNTNYYKDTELLTENKNYYDTDEFNVTIMKKIS